MKQIFSSGRPVMGDLLRAALWCAYNSPKSPAAAVIWESFDKVLTRLSAPQVTKAEIKQRLNALTSPFIAPMVVEAADWPIVLRLWRLLQAFGYKEMVIGSADAVGFGYGACLDLGGKDQYFSRRAPNHSPGIYLGLCPMELPIVQLERQPQTSMEVSGSGIRINGQLSSAEFTGLNAEMNSWITDLSNQTLPNLKALSIRAFNYDINPTSKGWSLAPTSPESAIRLATHCSRGALLAFVPDDKLNDKSEVVMTFLRPTDEAPTKLVSERHSRRGELADWLWLPALPIVLDLPDETRVALDAQLNLISAKG